MKSAAAPDFARFLHNYAAHRAEEGRALSGPDLFTLPYLRSGPLARQWGVRAASFDALMARVVRPMTEQVGAPLAVADLGAGNGWLSYRLALEGHRCIAVDVRSDAIDGLGAAREYLERGDVRFERVLASFEELPVESRSLDIAVFNASIHYAVELQAVLREAARVVRPAGLIAIVDSPFYETEDDGKAMVAEKKAEGALRFGARAEGLLSMPFIEYLTPGTLARASAPVGLEWRRLKVRYPLWYELRPLQARLKGHRRPSRFDIWVAEVP